MTNSDRAVEGRGFECMGHSCHEEIVAAGMLLADDEVMDRQGEVASSHSAECEIITFQGCESEMEGKPRAIGTGNAIDASDRIHSGMDEDELADVIDILHRRIVEIVRERRVPENRRTILASIGMIEAMHSEGSLSLGDGIEAYLQLARAVVEGSTSG